MVKTYFSEFMSIDALNIYLSNTPTVKVINWYIKPDGVVVVEFQDNDKTYLAE